MVDHAIIGPWDNHRHALPENEAVMKFGYNEVEIEDRWTDANKTRELALIHGLLILCLSAIPP